MAPYLTAVLLAVAVFLIGLARLIPHATAQRLLDVSGTVLAGVVLVTDLIAAH